MGKLKRCRWRIGSAPYRCGRASIGSGWSGGASRGCRLDLRPEEEDEPSGPKLGRVHWAQRPMGPVLVGHRKKWRRAARGNGSKSKNKEKWAV
jgi:hypothetical protein